MAALKQSGAETTIAEAEETCVVYGMPRAAVEKNGVMYILPQQDIPAKLIQTVMH
jgi:two-component system chemotaxis response regulator CheB